MPMILVKTPPLLSPPRPERREPSRFGVIKAAKLGCFFPRAGKDR